MEDLAVAKAGIMGGNFIIIFSYHIICYLSLILETLLCIFASQSQLLSILSNSLMFSLLSFVYFGVFLYPSVMITMKGIRPLYCMATMLRRRLLWKENGSISI